MQVDCSLQTDQTSNSCNCEARCEMSEERLEAEADAAPEQPQEERAKMRPIWYWVGWLLVVMGAIVFGAGIWDALLPPVNQVVLHHLHVGIWWGGIVTVFGWCMMWLNKDKMVD